MEVPIPYIRPIFEAYVREHPHKIWPPRSIRRGTLVQTYDEMDWEQAVSGPSRRSETETMGKPWEVVISPREMDILGSQF